MKLEEFLTVRNGPSIRRIRRLLGITQVELARAMGVHPASLSRWETGWLTPSPERLQQADEHIIRIVAARVRRLREEAEREGGA
jgi:transcriptional regulator with XRE-family HTH domain